MTRIVVLGGGYAGMTAAITLAARTKRRDDLTITLVNATERFTERLRLHQTAAGEQLADFKIPEALDGTRIEFVQGWVTGLDAQGVRVDDERVILYDKLIYALGSVADTATVPGADDHAYTLNTPQDADLLARRLGNAKTVAVCGSGLTGVEVAAEIAERHPDVRVVLLGRQEPGARMGPKAKAYLQASLDGLGVRVCAAASRS